MMRSYKRLWRTLKRIKNLGYREYRTARLEAA
jgi:hypothetical protein